MPKTINVLHFSTHDEDCGIAKYQEQLVEGMQAQGDIHNEFFRVSPNITRLMPPEELTRTIDELAQQMQKFDILHIQYEFSFYARDELALIVQRIKEMGKKVIITVHTAPDAQFKPAQRVGVSVRSFVKYARDKRAATTFVRNRIMPFREADLIIAPSPVIQENLVKHGVDAAKIKVIEHAVPHSLQPKKSTQITKALNRQPGDVIFCIVGFLSESKGVIDAIKALMFLPENYKLALIGGVHPSGSNQAFMNAATDLIYTLKLQHRVYITGYVDDAELEAGIAECDICVYPYDREYYAYVSSASLNNAVTVGKPIVAYPTKSFIETDKLAPFMSFCKSFNYYELARALPQVDIAAASTAVRKFGKLFTIERQAGIFAETYRQLIAQ